MPEMNNGFAESDGKPALVAPGARQPRPGHRPAKPDGTRPLLVPSHQGRRDDGLRPLLDGLRGRRPQGPRQQADRRGLPGHHDQPDQPRHHRHRPLGPAPDAGPGHDHRRRRAGVPRRVAGREPGDAQPQRRQQDPDAHLDLRPPDHPGRPVRRLPARSSTSCCSARTASTTRSSSRCASPTSRSAGSSDISASPRRRRQQGGPGPGADPRLPRARPPDGRHRPAGVPAAQPPRPRRHHPRPDPVGPRPRRSPPAASAASRSLKLRKILGILRDSYCRTIGIEYMHIQDPEQREWIQAKVEVPLRQARPARSSCGSCAGSTPPRRSRRSCRPSSSGRSGSRLEGGESVIPLLDRILCRAAERRASTRSASACRTAAGSTCWPTSPASPTARSSASSRATRTRKSVQGSGDVKYHLGTEGEFTSEDGSDDARSTSRRTPRTSRPSTRCSRASSAPSRTGSTSPARRSPCCPCSCTATRRSPARASWPRR